ncbi:MAG: hypothetical protein ABSG57_12125 [Candidatus Bathyarchaeia archaeon]
MSTFLRTTLSIWDVLSAGIEIAFYLVILAIYIDMKHIAIHYGNNAVSKATGRISKNLVIVAGFMLGLCSLSFAVGHAYSIPYLRLLSGFFFAMLVSCMVLVLSVKGLEAYGYLFALLAPLIDLAIVPPTSRFIISLTFTLPLALNLAIYWRMVRLEMQKMKLPSVRHVLEDGLRLSGDWEPWVSSALLLFVYLGIFIPIYYNLSVLELTQVVITGMIPVLVYCLMTFLYSPIAATVTLFLYFAFGVQLLWNIDAFLVFPLFIILSLPVLTVRVEDGDRASGTRERRRLGKPRN